MGTKSLHTKIDLLEHRIIEQEKEIEALKIRVNFFSEGLEERLDAAVTKVIGGGLEVAVQPTTDQLLKDHFTHDS